MDSFDLCGKPISILYKYLDSKGSCKSTPFGEKKNLKGFLPLSPHWSNLDFSPKGASVLLSGVIARRKSILGQSILYDTPSQDN